MKGLQAGIRQTRGATLLLWGAFLLGPGELQGQIGLASREARVTLVAQVPVRASLQTVDPLEGGVRLGTDRMASVMVRLSTNGGYRLNVRGIDPQIDADSGDQVRLWVRGLDGEFHELTSGSTITVAHEQHRAEESAREVLYRIQSSNPERGLPERLPVRYEIAVNPVI